MKKWHWSETVAPIIFSSYCLSYLVQVFGYPYKSVVYPYILIFLILLILIFITIKYSLIRIPATNSYLSRKSAGKEVRKNKISAQGLLNACKKVYKPASVLIATFLYSEIVEILGFTIATSVFLFVLLWIFNTRRILTLLALSLGIPVFLFYVMALYLKIALPSFTLAKLPLGL